MAVLKAVPVVTSEAVNRIDTPSVRPNGPARKQRLEFVDGVRALAALFVVAGHAYFEPTNGFYTSRVMNHLGLSYAAIAVDVFIVVSGFCLMLPIARRGDSMGSLRRFFGRRVRRIVPAYYATLIFSSVFILAFASQRTGTVWDNALPLTWSTFWRHALLVNNLYPHGQGGINYPLWSIAVEFQLYLLMPLIVLSLRQFGNGVTLVWTVGFGALIQLGPLSELRMTHLWFLGLFALGAIAARSCIHGMDRAAPAARNIGYVLWAAIAVAIVAGGRGLFMTYAVAFDTVIGVATALLLAATYVDAEMRDSRLTRVLSWRPLVAAGLFSYSLYLVHAPLLHAGYLILRHVAHPGPIAMFGLLISGTPLILVVAYLFSFVFERPFLNQPGSLATPALDVHHGRPHGEQADLQSSPARLAEAPADSGASASSVLT